MYHSVHGFFDCALTVDVYNICHGAQLAGLDLAKPFASLRFGLARQLASLHILLRPSLWGSSPVLAWLLTLLSNCYNTGHPSRRPQRHEQLGSCARDLG